MRRKWQFAEQNLQSTIYNLQCRRMQAYACDKRSRNHTYRRPRLKARGVNGGIGHAYPRAKVRLAQHFVNCKL